MPLCDIEILSNISGKEFAIKQIVYGILDLSYELKMSSHATLLVIKEYNELREAAMCLGFDIDVPQVDRPRYANDFPNQLSDKMLKGLSDIIGKIELSYPNIVCKSSPMRGTCENDFFMYIHLSRCYVNRLDVIAVLESEGFEWCKLHLHHRIREFNTFVRQFSLPVYFHYADHVIDRIRHAIIDVNSECSFFACIGFGKFNDYTKCRDFGETEMKMLESFHTSRPPALICTIGTENADHERVLDWLFQKGFYDPHFFEDGLTSIKMFGSESHEEIVSIAKSINNGVGEILKNNEFALFLGMPYF